MEIFLEISFILALAAFLGALVFVFKQPPLIGYLIAGLLVGSLGEGLIHSPQTLELFSKLGITLLLFIVGIHLTPQAIKDVGKESIILGVGQMVLSVLLGVAVSRLLGYSLGVGFFLGILLSFSSTIVVLKLLSDKSDEYSLYGRISIGLLLVQDVFAVLSLFLLPVFWSTTANLSFLFQFLSLVLRGTVLIFVLWLVGRYLLPPLFSFVAYSQELLFLWAITWGMASASLFFVFGFSLEAGALWAGVLVSTTEFAQEIAARSRPLRDFFLVLFFILLGFGIRFREVIVLLPQALPLLLLVMILKPLIVAFLLNILGFEKRVAFLSGITMSQISEFSLILAKAGVDYRYISNQEASLITLVALISITSSTYLILHLEKLYSMFSPFLSRILPLNNRREKAAGGDYEAVLFGYHRVGHQFVEAFKKRGLRFLVVDFNPQAIARLQKARIPHQYGDAQDVQFLEELRLEKVKLLISTVPDFETNRLLIRTLRRVNKKAVAIVIAHQAADAACFYKEGASFVVMPHYMGADYASSLIKKLGTDLRGFENLGRRHLSHLKKHYLKELQKERS